MSDNSKKKASSRNKPPAMSVVNIRMPDRLRHATDDFLKSSNLDDRSDLVRLAVATYIGQPELAKQQKEAA